MRSRRDESILTWSRPVKKTEILPASILPSSTSAGDLDYVAAPAPSLLAPSPKYFSGSGNIISIPPMQLERVNLHAPPILFDRLVWTLERSFMEDRDPKKREILAKDEVPYMAALTYLKGLDIHTPVKL